MISGVTRYRLQIAADESFQDVLLDRLVAGQVYRPTDLSPGQYYWRVAPSQRETGPFMRPIAFRVNAIITLVTMPAANKPATKRIQAGWLAAVGAIQHLAVIQSNGATSLIAVNSDRSVYALDSNRGIARWISRFTARPGSATSNSAFTPLVVNTKNSQLIVLAHDNGIRAVQAITGRQIWNVDLPSTVSSGVVAAGPGEDRTIYLINREFKELVVIDAIGGKIRKRVRLERVPTMQMTLLPGKGLLLPFKNSIELRSLEGEFVRSIAVDDELTTAPVVLRSARGLLLLVGTRKALVTLDAQTFQPLSRLSSAGDDYPIGPLVTADLDADGDLEVLMTTRRGRLMAADAAQGKEIWSRENPAGNATPLLVDLGGNGRVDLLLPGNNTQFIALSGVDGSTIKLNENAAPIDRRDTISRPLLAVRLSRGKLLIIGSDPTGFGIRAIEFREEFWVQNPRRNM